MLTSPCCQIVRRMQYRRLSASSCSWDTPLSPSCLSGRNPRPGGTVGISCSSVNTLTLILKSLTNQLFMNAFAENVPTLFLVEFYDFPTYPINLPPPVITSSLISLGPRANLKYSARLGATS